ncbi:MAG: ABC transporter substrate-binding protein [Ruminiclostridium sp.]
MKKITAALLGIILLAGCTESSDISAPLPDTCEDFYVYETTDYLGRFNVGKDGAMYLYTYTLDEKGQVEEYTLRKYDMEGNSAEICRPEKAPAAFDCRDGIIYGAYADSAENHSLYSFDTNALEQEKICTLTGYCQVNSIEICGDYAYILGISADRMGIEGEYISQFGAYSYGGEKLIRVELSTGEITESDVPYPIAISTYNNECVVYAADKEGYYFTDFGNSQKSRHNIELMLGFGMYDKDRFVFASGSGINIGVLCAGATNPDEGISQLADGYYPTGELYSVGGYTFFKTSAAEAEQAKICRLKNSKYIKKNNKIRLISCEYNFDAPFGCGYTIDYESLSADSFSLAVLSNDKSYDMCIVNSYQGHSSNIRDKGSFYPLNDVPNVKEYLDKCFPYIKAAAEDKNGDIWMLPLSVNIPVIVYNKDTCTETGIDFENGMTVEEFIAACERAYSSDYKNGFDVHPYVLTQNLLIGYMAEHDTFDTPAFRSFAQLSKEKINMQDMTAYPPYFPVTNLAQNRLYEKDGENMFLFSYHRDAGSAVWMSGFNSFRFAPVPSIDHSEKSGATCAFITVNPSSDNLEAALDYISSLAEYLSERENSFMLADKVSYSMNEGLESLYSLYENAQIGFNVSEEICFEPYVKYHSGQLTLDQMITEADRRLSAYLNE